MEILETIFYLSVAVWFATEIYYKRILKSDETAEKKDSSTLNILWIVIMPSVFLGVFISKTTAFEITDQDWIYFSGLTMIITGVLIRWMIIRSLGKYFTVDVSIRQDHKIKQDGIYQILRHPSYSFALLTFLGLGLYLNNWISLIIVFIPVCIAFRYRIAVEEKALIETFGDDYLNYRKRTKMLIPLIY
ncbi:isoprenylcysteine carboxylmethyltransferase family protein [Chryseobacterium sp. Leaf394]|uniref:methyltransferase family protein n=1 Tax=Chryseobacterium sp. Leaf394 TaxID=1736361 RepID=UPI0006FF479A|nr:isoprenylcysteine carboxylmethyltransferase family protein [Chryseobacterium sp. Leaf394]KQS90119.1 protein-S-isoprenylcysteine methyltransferase [Chryseobacterium sp. Leaf394]